MHDFLSLTKGGAQQDKIEGSAWGLAHQIHTQELADEVQFSAKVTHVYDHETQVKALGACSWGRGVVACPRSAVEIWLAGWLAGEAFLWKNCSCMRMLVHQKLSCNCS